MACVYEITELSNNMKYLGSHCEDPSAVGTTYFTSSSDEDFKKRYTKSCKESLGEFLTVAWDMEDFVKAQEEEHKMLQEVTDRDNYYNRIFYVWAIREIDENCMLRKWFGGDKVIRDRFRSHAKTHNIESTEENVNNWKEQYIPREEVLNNSIIRKWFGGDKNKRKPFDVWCKNNEFDKTDESVAKHYLENVYTPKTYKTKKWFDGDKNKNTSFVCWCKRHNYEESKENADYYLKNVYKKRTKKT